MNTVGNYTTKRTDSDVLAALHHFLQRGEGVAVREIAHHIHCCERTVRYAIERLQQCGKVEVLNVKGHPNRYRIIQ